MEDNTYRKFTIPAGSSVLVNIQYGFCFFFKFNEGSSSVQVPFCRTVTNQMSLSLNDILTTTNYQTLILSFSDSDVGERVHTPYTHGSLS